MLSFCTRPLLNPPLSSITHHHRRPFLRRITRHRHSLSSSVPKMSSETIEHIVLFKVKESTDSSQVAAMVNGLASLSSLDSVLHLTVGPIHKNRSNSLSFTHLLHSRYSSKEDLAHYSAHQAHLDVVRGSVLPICDDLMAVDWVGRVGSGPIGPKPGSAMRVQFVKLKEGLGEREKGEVLEVIGGMKEKVNGIEEVSFGENFSPARAKGFSIGSIGFFPELKVLEAVDEDEVIAKEKDKVRDYVDSLVVLDYVVPNPQSASL